MEDRQRDRSVDAQERLAALGRERVHEAVFLEVRNPLALRLAPRWLDLPPGSPGRQGRPQPGTLSLLQGVACNKAVALSVSAQATRH